MCDVTEPKNGLCVEQSRVMWKNSTQRNRSLQVDLGMRTGVEMHGWESFFHPLHGGSQFLRVRIKVRIHYTKIILNSKIL